MSIDERLGRALDDYRALVPPAAAGGDDVPEPGPNRRRTSVLAPAAAIVVALLVVGAVVAAGRSDVPTSLDTAGKDGATPSADAPVGDGGQVSGGDGWRLLGADLTGPTYRTGVATTAEQYRSLWAEAGLTTDAPEVDLTRDIVVWFGAVYGSSCPIRLDGIGVDPDPAVVYPVTVRPGGQVACTTDACGLTPSWSRSSERCFRSGRSWCSSVPRNRRRARPRSGPSFVSTCRVPGRRRRPRRSGSTRSCWPGPTSARRPCWAAVPSQVSVRGGRTRSRPPAVPGSWAS